jgi:hypothetical protein
MTELLRRRCFLVHAVAPESTTAADANDALNGYIEDRRRGTVVFHDHFSRAPHGGVAVFDVRSDDELRMLDDVGPLTGWRLGVHPLTFSSLPSASSSRRTSRSGSTRRRASTSCVERSRTILVSGGVAGGKHRSR